MSTLVLYMITTLDGFIAGPNGEFTDYEPSAEEMAFANELFGNANAILFGRVIYEGFVSYWDVMDVGDTTIPAHDREFATLFRKKPRVVFSRTLESVPADTTLIYEHRATEVMRLKAQSQGYLLLLCGPDLLADLIDDGVVDECQILITPSVMGQGMALFGKLQRRVDFTLLGTQAFESGSVLHHYRIHRD
jgi:dihydrofolate reductase